MAISRSLRPLAAAALAAGLVLPAAASAAGRPNGAGHGNAGHSSSYRGNQRHKVGGVLQTISGTTAPATLTVQAGSTTITVTVSARTRLLRCHGGRSGLAEFTPGDRITAWGSFEKGSTTAFAARKITDGSIAYSHVVGSVASVSSDGLTLGVARRGSAHSPYWRGEQVYVTLTSSTIVTSGSVTQTVSALQPGVRVQVAGLYDSAVSTTYQLPTLRADRVRILGTTSRRDPDATPTP